MTLGDFIEMCKEEKYPLDMTLQIFNEATEEMEEVQWVEPQFNFENGEVVSGGGTLTIGTTTD